VRKAWLLIVGAVLGALLLCVGVVLAPFLARWGSLDTARQRWAVNGGQDYTLIVSEICFCPNAGEWRLTVSNGQVIGIESLRETPVPSNLAEFNRLTVEAMSTQAERLVSETQLAPWFDTLAIDYDPTYGYVTRLEYDANGLLDFIFGSYVTDSDYHYTARDLSLTAP
jgi:uncharacterized protein DUF6174